MLSIIKLSRLAVLELVLLAWQFNIILSCSHLYCIILFVFYCILSEDE